MTPNDPQTHRARHTQPQPHIHCICPVSTPHQMRGQCDRRSIDSDLFQQAESVLQLGHRGQHRLSVRREGAVVAGPHQRALRTAHWCRDDLVQVARVVQAAVSILVEVPTVAVLQVVVARHAPLVERQLLAPHSRLLLYICHCGVRTGRSGQGRAAERDTKT